MSKECVVMLRDEHQSFTWRTTESSRWIRLGRAILFPLVLVAIGFWLGRSSDRASERLALNATAPSKPLAAVQPLPKPAGSPAQQRSNVTPASPPAKPLPPVIMLNSSVRSNDGLQETSTPPLAQPGRPEDASRYPNAVPNYRALRDQVLKGK